MKAGLRIILKAVKDIFIPFVTCVTLILFKTGYQENFPELIPSTLKGPINKMLLTIIAFTIGFLAQRISGTVIFWYGMTVAKATATKLDNELIPLLSKSVNILIWVIVLIAILPIYGINVTALITAIGVSSLAIALAAKDTISNIIAGFLILIDRPFRPGDKIKIPSGEVVTVVNIGIRRTTFLSEEKFMIIVPNTDLSSNKIINFTYGEELEQDTR